MNLLRKNLKIPNFIWIIFLLLLWNETVLKARCASCRGTFVFLFVIFELGNDIFYYNAGPMPLAFSNFCKIGTLPS